MSSFKNRLLKRFSYLSKWAFRHHHTCFRVYQKDIPEFPAIVDWYDGNVVAWLFDRTRDDTPEKKMVFELDLLGQLYEAFPSLSRDSFFIKRRGIQSGAEQYQRLSDSGANKVVSEQGLRFKLNFSDYLDVGLFLDHRHHREAVRQMSRGKRVLNLFAYTGSFTCYAMAGGASETTTVDMSKVYRAWTQENFVLNGFDVSDRHRLVQADCLAFLEKHNSRKLYDVIVCDPPTFSNSKRMEKGAFSVARDYGDLIASCLRILAPGGVLLFSTNAKGFRLDEAVLPGGVRCEDRTFPHPSEDFGERILHRCWYVMT